jgi:hypothetical protein
MQTSLSASSIDASSIDVSVRHSLEHEASQLFSAIFPCDDHRDIAHQYCAAHDHLFKSSPPAELRTVSLVVQKQLDAEAVELFLRRRRPTHLLSMKLHALIYITELSTRHCDLFVNRTPSRFLAVLDLIWAVAKWPIALAKGAYLAWRYDLV